MGRRRLIAANWKMHKTSEEAAEFAVNIKPLVSNVMDVDILICPAFIALTEMQTILKGTNILLGAQDIFYEKEGPFTGEISGEMARSAGARYVILGHSKRREIMNETNEIINKKLHASFNSNLLPILCIGETIEEKENQKTEEVLELQLKECLKDISIKNAKKLIIAYEPVWSISTSGTGKVATPDQAGKEHAFIRQQLENLFSREISDNIRILFGGSVDTFNIKSYLDIENIDGALVGGASLEPGSFAEIVEIANIDL